MKNFSLGCWARKTRTAAFTTNKHMKSLSLALWTVPKGPPQKGTAAELQETSAGQNKTPVELKETVAELKETIAELRGMIAEQKETPAELKETAAELKGTVAELKGTAADLKGMIAEKKETIAAEKRELHINMWNIGDNHAIDIGLMLPTSLFLNNQVYIFAPYEYKKYKFEDLYDSLEEREHKYLNAIFNSFFPVSPCKKNDLYRCASLDENTHFCLTPIKHKEIDFNGLDGSVIELSPKEQAQCENSKNYYLRFRISGEWIKSYYLHSEKESSRFENFSERVDFLDIGYNIPRILPSEIAKHIKTDQQIPLDVIQFFYICPASYKLELTKKEMTNMRSIEAEFWEDYFPHLRKLESKKDVALAYHRTATPVSKARLTHFSFLIKISYQKFQLRKAVIYFLLAVVVGVFISCLGSATYDNRSAIKKFLTWESTQEAVENNAIHK